MTTRAFPHPLRDYLERRRERRTAIEHSREAVKLLHQAIEHAARVSSTPVKAEDLESELTDVQERPLRPPR